MNTPRTKPKPRLKPGAIAIWAIAALITARLVWSSVQHHMPTAETVVIVFSVPLAISGGIEAIARGLRATRKGATR